jgi:hypothetical protein
MPFYFARRTLKTYTPTYQKKPNVSEASYLGNNRNSAARYTDRTVHVS